MITVEPLFEEIPPADINALINLFSDKKDLMVLNSSRHADDFGRYSFICFDTFASFSCKGNQYFWNNACVDIHEPFDFLNEKINAWKINKIEGLPPLQGGAVGYFGYEAGHYLEDLPKVTDSIELPDIYLNFYSTIISIDHASNQCWVIATGFPETDEFERINKAQRDISKIKSRRLDLGPTSPPIANAVLGQGSTYSNFTQESYISAVKTTKDYILNGDIFQANISQQFNASIPEHSNPLNLYFNLMKINPAPFSAFIKIPEHGYIISASPERFIKLTGQHVETCPIKGTRKRAMDPAEDKCLANELLTSEKDRAENVMIVDLMRNDMSKVCHSVCVEALCELKSFETVHHLVSKITATLKANLNSIDLIKATFPPGSVTGAPKIRAMEIISEIEQQTRGPYCGCLGYLSFTGDMDTSVIIRTYFMNKNKLFFSAGGAIVLDSDPAEEYQETLTKAQALMQALSI